MKDEGYQKSLSSRHVQMITVSLTLGAGLFLGTGGQLQVAGPGLVLAYLVAGIAAFFVLRAVGELVLYRQTSGGYVEYAREFLGPGAGFAVGWANWFSDAMSSIAQVTAISIYVHRWFPGVPQWVTAGIALAALLGVNMLAVRLFAELQFWLSLAKVLAIVVFLAVGVVALFVEPAAGPQNVTELFPNGYLVVVLSVQAAVFAFAGVESVAVSAGETREPDKTLAKIVNGVIWQIGVFFLGSLLLLVMVLPWTAYGPGESPFVTVFSQLGIPAAGDVMNLIALTAALSSCNSTIYTGARTTRAMALAGDAPGFAARMNARGAPYGAMVLSGSMCAGSVLINYLVPSRAFEIAVATSAFSLMTVWAALVLCQMRLRAKALRGEVERPSFRMPGAPWSGWFLLALMAAVLVMMAFGDPVQRAATLCAPVGVIAIAIGWKVVSTRRGAAADQRIPR